MEDPCKTCIVRVCCKIRYDSKIPCKCELYENFRSIIFCYYSRKSTKLEYNKKIIK